MNYYLKVRWKLKHTFTIVNYDRKAWIVQTTELDLSDDGLAADNGETLDKYFPKCYQFF
jgi:hypothetical protein